MLGGPTLWEEAGIPLSERSVLRADEKCRTLVTTFFFFLLLSVKQSEKFSPKRLTIISTFYRATGSLGTNAREHPYTSPFRGELLYAVVRS